MHPGLDTGAMTKTRYSESGHTIMSNATALIRCQPILNEVEVQIMGAFKTQPAPGPNW